jgi:SdpI/YfhL protein family
MPHRMLILIMFVPTALLIMGLALPLIRGAVKPNWLYGFRTSDTVSDPDLWYPANAYAGRWLLAVGAVMLLATCVVFWIPSVSDDAYAIGIVSGLGVLVLVMLALCMRRLGQLKRDRGARDD